MQLPSSFLPNLSKTCTTRGQTDPSIADALQTLRNIVGNAAVLADLDAFERSCTQRWLQRLITMTDNDQTVDEAARILTVLAEVAHGKPAFKRR